MDAKTIHTILDQSLNIKFCRMFTTKQFRKKSALLDDILLNAFGLQKEEDEDDENFDTEFNNETLDEKALAEVAKIVSVNLHHLGSSSMEKKFEIVKDLLSRLAIIPVKKGFNPTEPLIQTDTEKEKLTDNPRTPPPNNTIEETDDGGSDLFLDHFHYFSSKSATEMTSKNPIMNAIANTIFGLKKQNFILFGTNEKIRLDGYLELALEQCKIENLQDKTSLHGDCFLIVKTNEFEHYLMFLEHQREECNDILDHKDFEKMVICLRTNLKFNFHTRTRAGNGFTGMRADCFGVLSSRNNIYVLHMFGITKTIPSTQKMSVIYHLELFSSHRLTTLRGRKSFIDTIAVIIETYSKLEFKPPTGASIQPQITNTIDSLRLMSKLDDLESIERLKKDLPELAIDDLPDFGNGFTNTVNGNNYLVYIKANHNIYLVYGKDTIKQSTFSAYSGSNGKQKVFFYHMRNNKKSTKIMVFMEDITPSDEDTDNISNNIDDSNMGDEEKKRKRDDGNGGGEKKQKTQRSDTQVNQTPILQNSLQKFNTEFIKGCKDITFDHKCMYLETRTKYPINNSTTLTFTKVTDIFENELVMKTIAKYCENKSCLECGNLCRIFSYEKFNLEKSEAQALFGADTSKTTIHFTISEFIITWEKYLVKKQHVLKRTKIIVKLFMLVECIRAYLNGLKQLHALSIHHCDISLFNCGFRFCKTECGQFIPIIFDFNTSKMANQEWSIDILECKKTGKCCPGATLGYLPLPTHTKTSIAPFSKEHDVYSLGIVSMQLAHFLLSDSTLEISSKFEQEKQACVKDSLLPRMKEIMKTIHVKGEYQCVFDKLLDIFMRMVDSPALCIENDYCTLELAKIMEELQPNIISENLDVFVME